MNIGALVPSESDVAKLPRLPRFEHSLDRASGCEDAVGVGIADDFVKLQQIDMVGLKAFQRFADLRGRSRFVAAIDLCHQECLLPVTIAQSLAHANLALTAVVIPAVVEKVDA